MLTLLRSADGKYTIQLHIRHYAAEPTALRMNAGFYVMRFGLLKGLSAEFSGPTVILAQTRQKKLLSVSSLVCSSFRVSFLSKVRLRV
jgi:hypothetical protein